jgi:ribosomal subunit interface protein
VDIVVKGRHTEVPDRFREHVAEKLARVERFDAKVIRVDVEVSKEHNPRQSEISERIELTIHSRGPVIRAEASSDDRYAALDLAVARLDARLRKAADRRRVHHGSRTPRSVAAATAPLSNGLGLAADGSARGDTPASAGFEAKGEPVGGGEEAAERRLEGSIEVQGDGPMVVREKTHRARPMPLDQALYEMELVGHDFFLFVDKHSAQPSVVYRRRAYDYGVIRLSV